MDLRWIIDLRIHGVTLCEKCIARALTKGRLILEILHAYDDPGNTGMIRYSNRATVVVHNENKTKPGPATGGNQPGQVYTDGLGREYGGAVPVSVDT